MLKEDKLCCKYNKLKKKICESLIFAYAKFRENQTLANWRYSSVVY